MITIDISEPHDIPESIAKCPYCNGKLILYGLEEYEVKTDESIGEVFKPEFECSTEPDDIDSNEYDDWLDSHSDMPYVYWMPVEQTVTAWLNSDAVTLVDKEAEPAW